MNRCLQSTFRSFAQAAAAAIPMIALGGEAAAQCPSPRLEVGQPDPFASVGWDVGIDGSYAAVGAPEALVNGARTVSYTHLTLPTIYSV